MLGGEMKERRRLFEISLKVRVEDGFEESNGNEIKVEVWRKKVYEGNVKIDYVRDIIEMNGEDVNEI
jgi:hypothetical protein